MILFGLLYKKVLSKYHEYDRSIMNMIEVSSNHHKIVIKHHA